MTAVRSRRCVALRYRSRYRWPTTTNGRMVLLSSIGNVPSVEVRRAIRRCWHDVALSAVSAVGDVGWRPGVWQTFAANYRSQSPPPRPGSRGPGCHHDGRGRRAGAMALPSGPQPVTDRRAAIRSRTGTPGLCVCRFTGSLGAWDALPSHGVGNGGARPGVPMGPGGQRVGATGARGGRRGPARRVAGFPGGRRPSRCVSGSPGWPSRRSRRGRWR